MNNFRKTIHSKEHEHLRAMLKQQRDKLGLTQRALAERMGVIYSLIGKIETGDRRLDVIEFIDYCRALELEPSEVLSMLEKQ